MDVDEVMEYLEDIESESESDGSEGDAAVEEFEEDCSENEATVETSASIQRSTASTAHPRRSNPFLHSRLHSLFVYYVHSNVYVTAVRPRPRTQPYAGAKCATL